MSFGRGIHTCPGAPLARAEARIGFQRLLERTRNIRISEQHHGPPGGRDFRYVPTFILRGLTQLFIEFDPADGLTDQRRSFDGRALPHRPAPSAARRVLRPRDRDARGRSARARRHEGDDVPSTEKLIESFPALAAVEYRDLDVVGPHGPVPARLYIDPAGEPTDAFVWVHGGAFIFGDLDILESHWVALSIAARGVPVVALDYRKALNGVSFPVPSDDVLAGWRSRHRTCRRAVRRSGRRACTSAAAAPVPTWRSVSPSGSATTGEALPASVVGAYGVFHSELPPFSDELRAAMERHPNPMEFPPDLGRQINLRFAGDEATLADPYAFPGNGDVSGLPPVYLLNSEADHLRASGEEFGRQLDAAGVTVKVEFEPGTAHGHLNEAFDPAATRSIERIVDWIAAGAPDRERGQPDTRRNSSRRSGLRILPLAVRRKSATTTRCSGVFSAGDPGRGEVRSDGLEIEARAVTNLDEHRDPFPVPLVGHADRGDLDDVGMRRAEVLDLLRGDVLAAPDDEVLEPVGDRQVPVDVEAADVARAEPPARQEHLRIERRIGVADEQLRSARDDLALGARRDIGAVDVDQADLVPRSGDAVGPRPPVEQVARMSDGDDRVLGRPVRAEHRDPGGIGPFDQRTGTLPAPTRKLRSDERSRPSVAAASSSEARKNGAPDVAVTRCSSTNRAARCASQRSMTTVDIPSSTIRARPSTPAM